MTIEINSEDINNYVSKAIISSAVGEALKAAIDAEVKRLSSAHDNPYKKVVEAKIIQQVQQLLEQEYEEQIRSLIRQKLTDDFVSELMSALWDKFLEKRF